MASSSTEGEVLECSERDLIEHYFNRGYKYVTIVSLLERHHNISMSVRTLKRRIDDYGLKKKKSEVDAEQTRRLIQEIILGPGSMWGYRRVWHALRIRFQLHVPCRLVSTILRELDPEGVTLRRQHKFSRRKYVSSGPNYCWHIDGYDKLKPYGFPVHGAIDGYSRKILWMEIVRSNNDLRIPAKLYLDCVKQEGVCPRLLWSDCGTENGIAATMQCFFRKDGEDDLAGEKAHRYGNSHANQRIEAFCSIYRRTRSSWWIDYFKNLVQTGRVYSVK